MSDSTHEFHIGKAAGRTHAFLAPTAIAEETLAEQEALEAKGALTAYGRGFRAGIKEMLNEKAAAADAVPAHQRPENCHVCGEPEHADTGHRFWSNADALAEATERDRQTTVRYSNGEATPEGAYVAEHRPY